MSSICLVKLDLKFYLFFKIRKEVSLTYLKKSDDNNNDNINDNDTNISSINIERRWGGEERTGDHLAGLTFCIARQQNI